MIRLVDIYGQTAAMYKYDPFGNAIYATGSHAQINPLRYRSYYFDSETGLYYLQSRYYDPQVGRFINADSYASTGQGILGCNMFAYCNNNPINYSDSSGTRMVYTQEDFFGDGLGFSTAGFDPNGSYSPGSSGSLGREITDFITNEEEQAVLAAKRFAMYKGVPVIKLPIGTDAFSFGIIFLGDGVENRADAIETVQHEYGHSVHFALAGPISYTVNAFIPSIIGYHFGGEEYQNNYYSYVYEYTADILGNVDRGNYSYSSITEDWWVAYLLYTLQFP